MDYATMKRRGYPIGSGVVRDQRGQASLIATWTMQL
jgi:hypothetical protein